MPIIALNDQLRKDLQRLLLALPNIDVQSMRRAYLHGAFSDLALPGITEFAAADVMQTIRYLDKVGTLEGGRWPVLMLVDQVVDVLPGGALKAEVEQLRRRIELYYATRAQPEVAASAVPDTGHLEAIVDEDDRLPYTFVETALSVAKAVAIISVHPRGSSPSSGTCWLLTPEHIITNWHVVACLQPGLGEARMRSNLEGAVVRFDYLDSRRLGEPAGTLSWVCGSETLDFAVLALPSPQASRSPLAVSRARVEKGKKLNVVQHPLGRPLSFAIRENDYVASPSPHLVQYLSDTEPGSSGSPVCDDAWNVVALHHAAREVDVVVKNRHYTLLNEGISMAAILEALPRAVRDRVSVLDT